jgi:tetratricopeptide (TPR) repeat protein
MVSARAADHRLLHGVLSRYPFLAAALAVTLFCSCATLAGRNQPPASARVPNIAEIDSKLAALRPILRSYPASIASEEQRRQVERRWHEAEDALERFSETHPNQSPVEYRMGELYRFGHNLGIEGAADRCVAHLQRAVALQPDFAEAYLELGMFYTDSGPRWASSGETNLKKAIELSRPTPAPRAWRALSLAYYYQAKFAQAESAADRYLMLVPDDEDVRHIKQLAREAAARGATEIPPIVSPARDPTSSSAPQSRVQ